jgi:LytR cell envelope-related transcriptional attenuator
MRKSWPYLVAVGALGAIAGLAISGGPTRSDSFVIDPALTLPNTTLPNTTVPNTTVPATLPPSPQTSTPAPTSPATPSPTTTAPTAPTPTAPTPTAPTPTTAATSGTVARADVRLVIANGDGRFNLATANADRLRAAGYVHIDETDVSKHVAATILYFRPGFDDEAAVVAADLGIPDALRAPLPTGGPATTITPDDSLGDIIVVLGPDALR